MLGPKALALVSAMLAGEPSITQDALSCMAANIYHEARSQSFKAQVAVAVVTLNRVEHRKFPNTVCDVVFENRRPGRKHACQYSWTCDGKSDRPTDWRAIRRAILIAYHTMKGRLEADVGNATHYYAHKLVTKPHRWMREYHTVAVIEGHTFKVMP